MSVAHTGLPHTSRTRPATETAPLALADPMPSGNGQHSPAALVPPRRRTAAPMRTRMRSPHRTRGPGVQALVARERAGGPTVTAAEVIALTGRSRRRASSCSATPAPSRDDAAMDVRVFYRTCPTCGGGSVRTDTELD